MFEKERFRRQLEESAEKARRRFPSVVALAVASIVATIWVTVRFDSVALIYGLIVLGPVTAGLGSYAISLWCSRTVNYEEADAFIDRVNSMAVRNRRNR